MSSYPEICFVEDTDAYDLQMANVKGLFAFDVKVSDDKRVRVQFINMDSYLWEVRTAEQRGECYYNPELLVLSELTQEKMYKAIHYLHARGELARWRSWPRLESYETVLIGERTSDGRKVIDQSACKRIGELTTGYLKEMAVTDDGWSTLFRDPSDGRLWELDFPQGDYHGGGPPRLRHISDEQALGRYGIVSKATTV